MTLLPIVERELRRAARRPGTYWSRLLVALAALAISVVLFAANVSLSATQIGQALFRGLSGLLLLFCLLQGRRGAADSLSEEKREGTLGLLFLTDLKGLDVVLGKLTATSLGGFYGLMAAFPILAMSLLLGGISNGEFWRMVLVLVNTFLFSLAVGSLTSALSREHRRAMAANFLLLLLLAGLPAGCALLILYFSPTNQFIAELCYSCPVFTFYYAFDLAYVLNPQAFWCSLGTTHALAWALVGLASLAVSRNWHDRPAGTTTTPWRQFWRSFVYGPRSGQALFRRRLLDHNAFYWLASRARLKSVHVWLFLVMLGVWWLIGWETAGAYWLDPATAVILALLANTTLKIWLAIEAGRALVEEQHAGALELLLSTPFGVADILRGQWLALRRQFLKPFLATLALELLLLLWVSRRYAGAWVPAIWLTGMVMLVLDALALGWVAMRQALTARNHNLATLRTLLRVLLSPCLAGVLILVLVQAWTFLRLGQLWEPTWAGWLGLWFWPGLAADVLFGWLARRQLYAHFRDYALQRYAPASPSGFLPDSLVPAAAVPAPKANPQPEPSRISHRWKPRRAVALCALLLLVGGGTAWYVRHSRSAFPPPLLVSLSQTNTPLQICRAGSVFLLLPDGSLWRWTLPAPMGTFQVSSPEPVGTNHDWCELSGDGPICLARHSDGSVWEWGWPSAIDSPPRRVPLPGNDWVGLGGFGEYYALRRDGSLWSWTTTRAPGPLYLPSSPELPTNQKWAAVRSIPGAMLGLQTDGTLWVWGYVRTSSSLAPWSGFTPVPLQVCADTNWVALEAGFRSGLAWTRSGELWDPLQARPNPKSPVAATGLLILSNSSPDHVAFGYTDKPEIYQIRADGTLWRKFYPMIGFYLPTEDWSQVGHRADWVRLCSAGGLVLGLTRDGTLWTWGIDFSHPGSVSLASQLNVAQNNLGALLGGRPSRGGAPAVFRPAVVPDPRPLMKLRPAPRARSAQPPGRGTK